MMTELYLDRTLLAVILGFILDLLLGDPSWLYHPVRMIGKAIEFFEKITRSLFPKDRHGERAAGVCCAVCVILVSTLVPFFLLKTFKLFFKR